MKLQMPFRVPYDEIQMRYRGYAVVGNLARYAVHCMNLCIAVIPYCMHKETGGQ